MDLGNFLQNEIDKKEQELAVNKEGGSASNVKLWRSLPSEKGSIDDKKVAADKTSSTHLQEKLSRLRSRPQRVQDTIKRERSMETHIEIAEINETADIEKLSLKCNLYLHRVLEEWQREVSTYHPELFIETKKSLLVLLVKLRKGKLAHDLLISLATVLYHMQRPGELNLAVQSYLKMSVGNVAWPIGVTQVGIHARSAQSRIRGEGNNVANIMIDENTRLWITSIKRLITFKEWLLERK